MKRGASPLLNTPVNMGQLISLHNTLRGEKLWYNDGMRKAFNKIKRNRELLVALGITVALCLFLGWTFDNYGPNIALMWLAVLIAAITAIATLWSLKTTRESLGLSRATQRPFLNVSVPKTILFQSELWLVICNTGALPADKVEILCTLCTMENEVVIKEYELPIWHEAPSIYFPGDEVGPTYCWSPKDYDFTNDSIRGKTLIRVTIDYRNRLTQETHTTTRVFMAKISNMQGQYLLMPIPKYDSWDEPMKV